VTRDPHNSILYNNNNNNNMHIEKYRKKDWGKSQNTVIITSKKVNSFVLVWLYRDFFIIQA
jgi:hypothetical protein